MKQCPSPATRRRTARLVAAAATVMLVRSSFGDGGIDDARDRRKQIEDGSDGAAVERELVAGGNPDGQGTELVRHHGPGAAPVPLPVVRRRGRRLGPTGRNVGRDRAATTIYESFVASSPHYATLTGSALTHRAAGAARGPDGTLFVTEVFIEAARPSTPAPTTPAPRTRAPSPPIAARPPGTAGPPSVCPAGPLQRWPRLLDILGQLRELRR